MNEPISKLGQQARERLQEPIWNVVMVNEEGEQVVERENRTYETACSKMRDLQEAGFVAWVE